MLHKAYSSLGQLFNDILLTITIRVRNFLGKLNKGLTKSTF